MDIPFELETGQAVGVTRHALNKLLALQNGTAALLYCYLLANPQPLDIKQAALATGIEQPEAAKAFTLLRDKGLLSTISAPMQFKETAPVFQAEARPSRGLESDDRPAYTSQQVADAMERQNDFRAVVREAETRLGKLLSTSDLQTLYSIYDWRGLPAGVINLLITHCSEESRDRHGPGRPPTMKNIDKEAAAWERDGIDTEQRAEEYLAELADRKTRRSEIMSILQIRGRAPSPTEERYLKDWSVHPIDLISIAYDKTVIRTGSLNWKYMDAILKNWKEKNLTTPGEVESGDVVKRPAPSAQPLRGRVQQTEQGAGERERAAVEDMKDFLKRLRVEEDL